MLILPRESDPARISNWHHPNVQRKDSTEMDSTDNRLHCDAFMYGKDISFASVPVLQQKVLCNQRLNVSFLCIHERPERIKSHEVSSLSYHVYNNTLNSPRYTCNNLLSTQSRCILLIGLTHWIRRHLSEIVVQQIRCLFIPRECNGASKLTTFFPVLWFLTRNSIPLISYTCSSIKQSTKEVSCSEVM